MSNFYHALLLEEWRFLLDIQGMSNEGKIELAPKLQQIMNKYRGNKNNIEFFDEIIALLGNYEEKYPGRRKVSDMGAFKIIDI
jgi:uncharacterized protein YmfQ (DUF2313 family)